MSSVSKVTKSINDIISFLKAIKNDVTEGIGSISLVTSETQKMLTDIAKEEYNQRLKLAKQLADREVSIYETRIAEIDAQIRTLDRQEADEDHEDKIKRLKAQLEYETDDFNRYELEKQIKQEQDANNKRKAKEKLQDEKDALNQLINWTKDSYAQQARAYQISLEQELSMLQANLQQKQMLLQSFNQSGIQETTSEVNALSSVISKLQSLFTQSGASFSYAQAAAQMGLDYSIYDNINAGTTEQVVNVYQTIQASALSPSDIAKETALAMERALRYGT